MLQREQENEIAKLEKEVHDMRAKHSEAVQKLKAKFIEEKCTFQKTSDEKLNKLTKEANLVKSCFVFSYLWIARSCGVGGVVPLEGTLVIGGRSITLSPLL